jgi:tetratricopeptide (TPR) repeat protein
MSDGVLSPEEGVARGREAATRALEIDPDYAPAHAHLGALATSEGDFAAAARHCERALALDPANASVLGEGTRLLLSLGRPREALALQETALGRDPMNPDALRTLGRAQVWTGQFDAAIASYRTLLSLQPTESQPHYAIGVALLLQGKAPEALAEFEQEPSDIWRGFGLAMAYHALGRKPESDAALAEVIAKHEKEAAFNVAYIHAFRGEADRGFEWLDKAVEYRDPGLSDIVAENLLANLHSDPRWLPFLRKIGMAPEQLAKIEFEVDLSKIR